MVSLKFMTFNSVNFQGNSIQHRQGSSNVNLKAQPGKDVISFSSNIKTVMLRTGIEEAEPLVKVVMMSLETLAGDGLSGMLALYDLAAKCKDPAYKFFGKAEQTLKKLNLVQEDGKIHDSVKNIIRAASEGDGLEFRLVNPITGK